MSERRINLEEILSKRIVLEPSHIRKEILIAMKEACRQTLELATENAETSFEPIIGFHVCPGDGDYVVNKQSILDTMNFIE